MGQPKEDVMMRLKRIEGQMRGLQRMVEEGVPCPEIMIQVAAATAAMKKVGTVIVQTYMEECLEKAQANSGVKGPQSLMDLQKAISQYIDWT